MKQLKKTILTLVALLAVTTGAWAQEVTKIAVGGSTQNNNYVPLPGNLAQNYTKCEFVYPATMLTALNGYDIKKMTFGAVAGNQNWGDARFQVFLKEVDFTTISAYSGTDNATTVYEGVLYLLGTHEMEITFTIPYTYHGGNLLIGVYQTVKGNKGGLPQWLGENATGASVRGYNSSSLDAVTTATQCNFLPKVTFTCVSSAPAPSGTPVTVAWTAATKTGTFGMPGGNVELEPEYYPQATAAEGAVTAATGVAATTDAPLVTVDATKLTGVAKMMYYVSTEATAPAYGAEGWTDVLPTAANYTEAGNLNVWYYPVGTDEGVGGATATYSDGDICATALTVTLAPSPTADVTLTDGDGITALSSHTGQTITVAYTRSFTASTASTVCLPFAYTKKAADGSFYAFTNIEKVGSDYVATMTEPGLSTLEANTPYLYLPNATGDFSFSGTYTIPATLTAGSVTSNGWTFKGTYEPIEWTTAPTGIYGFSGQTVGGISQGQFVKVGAYVRIAPMRCYLENASFAGARGANGAASEVLPETIKLRLISANGTVTAIGSLSTKTGEVTLDNDAWYSLDGRRVANPAKGVYVKNGKKVVIK